MSGYLEPLFGAKRVRDLTRQDIKRAFQDLAGRSRSDGRGLLAAGTRHGAYRVLRLLLAEGVEDGLLPANPASRLGKRLGLTHSKQGEARGDQGDDA
jgi:hypothetical protein